MVFRMRFSLYVINSDITISTNEDSWTYFIFASNGGKMKDNTFSYFGVRVGREQGDKIDDSTNQC